MFSVLFSVFIWRGHHHFLECVHKILHGAVAGRERDLLDGHVGQGKETARVFEPQGIQVLVETAVHLLFKQHAEVVRSEGKMSCQLGKRKLFLKVLVNVRDRLLYRERCRRKASVCCFSERRNDDLRDDTLAA